MRKRITDAQLGATFVNGQILYDYNLNEIINVLKAGVNANKAELNTIITGNSEMLVFTDADFYEIKGDGADGELAININTDVGEVQFIRKEEGAWKTVESIEPMSLMDIYDRIDDLKADEIAYNDKKNVKEAIDGKVDKTEFDAHKNSVNNPHGVTAAQVGTYDKTVINAMLETKADKTQLNNYVTTSTFDMQMLEKLGVKPNGTDLLIIGGKINPLYIDATSHQVNHPTVNSQAAMLALDVPLGTVVVRLDTPAKELFLLTKLPASTLANWQLVSSNTVVSVAGRTGVVVLGITDIDGLTDALNLKLDTTTFESQLAQLQSDIAAKATKTEFNEHKDDKNNPHEVTAEQVGTYTKTTIDGKDADTLQDAKDYTYSKVEIDIKDAALMDKIDNLEDNIVGGVVGGTNLSIPSITAASINIKSSTGNEVTVPAADEHFAGLLSGGAQKIGGAKTFMTIPILPEKDPTSPNQAARKEYVDNKIANIVKGTDLSIERSESGNTIKSSTGEGEAVINGATRELAGLVTARDQTWSGVKMFLSSPLVPEPTEPTEAASKQYVDNKIEVSAVTNLSIPSKTPSSISIKSSTGNEIDIPAADESFAGLLTAGAQKIEGAKTFVRSPIVPDPEKDNQAASKKYVDDEITESKTYVDNELAEVKDLAAGTYGKTTIDGKDADTLQEAKDYTYSKAEIDGKDTAILDKIGNLEIDLGDVVGDPRLNNHLKDLENPHQVTAEQVGTYTKAVIDDKDSAIIDRIDNLEVDLSDVIGDPRLDNHLKDKNNPHGVTAEQVGTYGKTTIDGKDADILKDAKDYTYSKVEIDGKDADTLQEAKDYTYSKAEIDGKDTAILDKIGNLEIDLGDVVDDLTLSNHIGDKNNPHGVTAAQVGTYGKTEINSMLDNKVDKTQLTNYVTTSTFDMQMLEKLAIKPNGTDLLIIGGMINPLYIDDVSYKVNHPTVNSQAAMLALDVPLGTVVVRLDTPAKELFLLTKLPASTLANWQLVSSNTVVSVAGKTGAVVLGITDIDGLTDALNLKLDTTTFESQLAQLQSDVMDKIDNLEVDLSDVIGDPRLDNHLKDKNNPHGVTAEQVGTYGKTTIDGKDADILKDAKDYTYSKVEINNRDAVILKDAKDYTYSKVEIDGKDADILKDAKDYAYSKAETDTKDADMLDKIGNLEDLAVGGTNLSIPSITAASISIKSSTGNKIAIPAADGNLAGLLSGGAQEIGGIKIFTSSPSVPTPRDDTDAASKKYVDDEITEVKDLASVGTDLSINKTKTTNTIISSTGDNAVITAADEDSAGLVTTVAQTFGGVKTFTSIPVIPTSNPTDTNQVASKAYVDGQVKGKANLEGATFTGHTSFDYNLGHVLEFKAKGSYNPSYVRNSAGKLVLQNHGMSSYSPISTEDYVDSEIAEVKGLASVGTDLSIEKSKTTNTIISSTGDNATITAADRNSAGLVTAGEQTFGGVKTFASIPELPAKDPTTTNQVVRKAYVDKQVNSKMEKVSSVNGLNMNDVTETGFYYGYSMTNAAVTGISTFMVINYSPDWIIQKQFVPASAGNREFIRSRHSGTTWSDWTENASQPWVTSNTRSNTWTPKWDQISDIPDWIGSSKPPYNLNEISDGTTYKRVSQTEKNTWNGKFNAPGGSTSQYVRGDGSLATFPAIAGEYVMTKSKIDTALQGYYNYSIQLGEGATATGNPSISIGRIATSSGENSIAIGTRATASAFAAALGYNTTAEGSNATALGRNASASGWGGVAVGSSASASGSSSVALGGTSTTASGTNSVAIGVYARAQGENSTALGYNARTGTTSNLLRLGATNLSTLESSKSLTVTSDIRDKTDIEEVPKALDFIKDLNPITYVSNDRENYISDEQKETDTYKDYLMVEDYDRKSHSKGTKKGSRRRVGLSAQEVRAKLIEHYGSDNYANVVNDNFVEFEERKLDVPKGLENKLTMSYETMVPFLIKAIQEQQEQIEELKKKINKG